MSSLSRLRGIIFAICCTSLVGTAAEAGTIKLAMTTWVGYGPLFLARDLGYFKENGLDVDLEIIEESALYMAAMAGGRIQGVADTFDDISKYRAPEACFKAVYALDDSHGGDGVLVPPDVKSFADLKGRDVALNEGSVSQFWFNILLKKNGLKESDVNIVNMTADDAAAAFMADRVPVAVTWEPHLTEAKNAKKGRLLINSTETPGAIVDVIALRCDTIQSSPNDVKALVAGLKKANEFLKSNPDKAYEIMAKGVGGYLSNPKDFAASAAGVHFYGYDRAKEFLGENEDGEAGKLLGLVRDIWGTRGKLKMDVKYSDLVDPTFVK